MPTIPNLDDVLRQLYGNGKPCILAYHCIVFAAAADEISQLLTAMRIGGPLLKAIPNVPPLSEWLPLYRDHRQITDVVGPLTFEAEELAKLPDAAEVVSESIEDMKLSDVEDAWRALLTAPAEGLKSFFESTPDTARDFTRALTGIAWPPSESMAREVMKRMDHADERFDTAMFTPEVQFFLRVWLPCILEYDAYPSQLFHRARCGDLDALDDLLRLDKSVMNDPLIAQRWHEASQARNEAWLDRVAAAMKSQPRGSQAPKRVRERFAGLMSQLSIMLKCPLNAKEIRDVFDVVSQVKCGHIDTELPDDLEALRKAISRNRKWSLFARVDKVSS